MTNHEDEPVQGDQIISRLAPSIGALVAGSDELSELFITPFVEAATLDLDSLDPETKALILESRRRADQAWKKVDELDEEERMANGFTHKQWEEQKVVNFVDVVMGSPPSE